MVTEKEFIGQSYIKASRAFGINAKNLRKDIPLAGSPERSAFRTVVEDDNQNLYLLESIFLQNVQRKEQIALNIDKLINNGLPGIVPYLSVKESGHIVHSGQQHWLMSVYVPGEVLERPNYAFDEWRGQVLADFLIHLKQTGRNLYNAIGQSGLSNPQDLFPAKRKIDSMSFFSIASYAKKIMSDMKNNDPDYLSGFLPFFEKLEENFFECHDQLPKMFCHGDFHPMNIIWGKSRIRAVIDWEFSGIKPEAYDIANLLGCLGIEHPHALTGKLVLSCLKVLKESAFISPESWDSLLDFILALRFAWLSEWLRRKDLQMIEMERKYMEILLENAHDLERIWGISR